MFLNTIRCRNCLPFRSLASRDKIICPSLNSPTTSRYPPSLSTHVCFHLPCRASNSETLLPRKCIVCPPEKLSSTTQPSSTRRMLLVPCWSSSSGPGQVSFQSPTQKSSCFCSGRVQGLVDC